VIEIGTALYRGAGVLSENGTVSAHWYCLSISLIC